MHRLFLACAGVALLMATESHARTASASRSPSFVPSASPTAPPRADFRCGDGVCDAPFLRVGETCGSCPDDCGPCQSSADAKTCVDPHTYALTFDDGPSPVSPSLLAALASLRVTASFFLVGESIGARGEVLQAEAAAGHSTLAHTYAHAHDSFNALSPQGVHAQLAQSDAAFARFGCRRPTLVRPPYGDLDGVRRTVLNNMGLRAVTWNLDSEDWRYAATNTDWLTGNFTQQLDLLPPSDSVIHLQNDIYQESVDAVPVFVAEVRRRGYSFVNIEQCVWGATYQQHPSWVFMNRDCNTEWGQANSSSGAAVTSAATVALSSDARVSWPAASSCPLSNWSEWSQCDAGCSGTTGTQTRVRLTMPPQLRYTRSCPSGGGELIQQRVCVASAGACASAGEGSQTQPPLATSACDVALGPWTWWNASEACSAPCGVGTQRQFRVVTGHTMPTHAGEMTSAQVQELEGVPLACGPVTRVVLCTAAVCVAPSSSPSPLPSCSSDSGTCTTAGTNSVDAVSGFAKYKSVIMGSGAFGVLLGMMGLAMRYMRKRLNGNPENKAPVSPSKAGSSSVGGGIVGGMNFISGGASGSSGARAQALPRDAGGKQQDGHQAAVHTPTVSSHEHHVPSRSRYSGADLSALDNHRIVTKHKQRSNVHSVQPTHPNRPSPPQQSERSLESEQLGGPIPSLNDEFGSGNSKDFEGNSASEPDETSSDEDNKSCQWQRDSFESGSKLPSAPTGTGSAREDVISYVAAAQRCEAAAQIPVPSRQCKRVATGRLAIPCRRQQKLASKEAFPGLVQDASHRDWRRNAARVIALASTSNSLRSKLAAQSITSGLSGTQSPTQQTTLDMRHPTGRDYAGTWKAYRASMQPARSDFGPAHAVVSMMVGGVVIGHSSSKEPPTQRITEDATSWNRGYRRECDSSTGCSNSDVSSMLQAGRTFDHHSPSSLASPSRLPVLPVPNVPTTSVVHKYW